MATFRALADHGFDVAYDPGITRYFQQGETVWIDTPS